MGTWAAGNFDNDSAMDFVSDIAREVRKELAPPECAEEIDLVMAGVAMLKALVEHCHAPAPALGEIEGLKEEVLAIYDEEIDGLAPDPAYKKERRAVLVKTFDDFITLVGKRGG